MSALTGRPVTARERGRTGAAEANAVEPTLDARSAPRIPRRSASLTDLQALLLLLALIALPGLVYGIWLEVLTLARFLGWMIWRPAP